MSKCVSCIKIKGRFFENETSLSLFQDEKPVGKNNCPKSLTCSNKPANPPSEKIFYQNALIYAENGSGKTTISKGIRSIELGEKDPEIQVNIFDENKNEITHDISCKVYNEDYIEKNIKVEKSGLTCICMLGKQIKTEEKIKCFQHAKKKIEGRIPDEERKLSTLQEKLGKCKNKIFDTLKGDEAWSGWNRKIKNILRATRGEQDQKTNTRVDSETVERLSKYKDIPLETEKLQTDFSSKIELLNQRGEYINRKLPEIQGSRQEVNFEIYKDLLGRKIQKNATLSEREKKIVELITSNPQKYKNQEKEIENTEICPYCFRKIDEALRREILSYISSSLADDDFQAHMRELEYEYSKIEALKISIDLSIYRVLGDETCESLNLSVDKFNTSVEALLEYIKQKKESVYNPILISSSDKAWNDFTKSKNDLNSEASQFNERIKVFNEEIDKLENFIGDVLCLNDKRGWLAIKNDFENSEKLKISNSLQEKRLERHRQALSFFDRKINNLEAQLRGYTIAKDTINKYLAYIFCDKTRLSLVEKGQFYGIYSRGKEIVSPAQLSQGERNVLALSFFFTQINENLTKDAEFTKDLFIVVDDPISSVDNLNKVGVYSFLRLIFSEITKKSNSQILIFSHSLNAIYNLHRVLENLDKNFIIKELASKRIINFPFKKKNEYSVNLMEVYKFAKKKNELFKRLFAWHDWEYYA